MSTGINNGVSQALQHLNAVQLRQLADDVGDASRKPSALFEKVARQAGLSTRQALQSPQFRAGVEAACLKVGVPRYGEHAALISDASQGGLPPGASLGHQFRLNQPGHPAERKQLNIKDVIQDPSIPLDDRIAIGLMEMDRLVGLPIEALRKDLSLVKGSSGKVDLTALQTRGDVTGRRLDLLEDAGKQLLTGKANFLKEEFRDVLSGMNRAQLRTLGAKCIETAQGARNQLFDLPPMDPMFR